MRNELGFGLHDALHVLKGLEARARGDMSVRGTALLVKPLLALANKFSTILVGSGSRSFVEFFPVSSGRYRCSRFLGGQELRPISRGLIGRASCRERV